VFLLVFYCWFTVWLWLMSLRDPVASRLLLPLTQLCAKFSLYHILVLYVLIQFLKVV